MGPWNLSLAPADQADRLRYSLVLLGLLAWLLYTRVFWMLHSAGATFPTCPFLLLTGQPCPLCGGTRSFAQMWQADWEQYDGDTLCARAHVIARQLDPMR